MIILFDLFLHYATQYEFQTQGYLTALHAMKVQGDVDVRVHIYTATTLEIKVASSTLDRLYPGKIPVFILQKAEWTLGLVWTRCGAEKNLHPSDYRDRTRAVKSLAKSLTA